MLLLQATHFLSLVWSEQISSVIRQKDESQYRGNKKTKHIKFDMLCFITSVLRFTLLLNYQRYGNLSLRTVSIVLPLLKQTKWSKKFQICVLFKNAWTSYIFLTCNNRKINWKTALWRRLHRTSIVIVSSLLSDWIFFCHREE